MVNSESSTEKTRVLNRRRRVNTQAILLMFHFSIFIFQFAICILTFDFCIALSAVLFHGLPILLTYHFPIYIFQFAFCTLFSEVLFHRPFLQPLVVGTAADPLARPGVVEERHAAAVSLVVLPHEPGIGLVVPDFEPGHLDPFFLLQPLHERFRVVAVGSLRAGELEQVKFRLGHDLSSFPNRECVTSP
jgi:hypothetical protein